jgi:hypothetical protein
LASVQRIRKSIAAVAKAINLTRDEKIVSKNGNFPAGTGADYD